MGTGERDERVQPTETGPDSGKTRLGGGDRLGAGDGRSGGEGPGGDQSGSGAHGERLGTRFVKLWTASTTSAFGSGLTSVAAALLAASMTGSPVMVSVTFGATWLPWLLFTLPGGVLVDRVDRRRLMMVIDAVRFLVVGAFAVTVVAGRAGIVPLCAVLFLLNTGEAVFRSASQAMIPSVVPHALLERANGRLFGGTMLMQMLIAAPLGGFLFALSPSAPFFADAGTYLVSAVVIGIMGGTYRFRPPEGPEPLPRRRVRAELAEGFGWLFRQRLVRTMALLIGLLNITFTAATAVLVLLARDRLHLGSVGYGLLLAATAVGGLFGALAGEALIRRFTARWTIRIGLVVEAGFHLVLAASTNLPLIGIVLFLFGVHGALWGIVGSSLRQRLTPPHLLGRVGSSMVFTAAGGNCVGALLGGVIAGRFGLTAPYWAGFVIAALVSVATWRVFDRASVSAAYARPTEEVPVPDATA
jgi:MFS family permease